MRIGTKNFMLVTMILSVLVTLLGLLGMTFDARAAPPTVYADFNGDGFDDLAVGVSLEDIGSISDAGAVNVIYGTSSGLSNLGDQNWHQGGSILDLPESGDNFGYVLTAGDFNGDGFDDLAVGVRGENIGSISDAGAVNVIYGSSSGLSPLGDQIWNQDSSGIFGVTGSGDLFGDALAAGNFDGDRFDDLAVGIPNEDDIFPNISISDAGAVNVIYGSSGGLSSTGDQLWDQNSLGIGAESDDHFGSVVE